MRHIKGIEEFEGFGHRAQRVPCNDRDRAKWNTPVDESLHVLGDGLGSRSPSRIDTL